MRRKFTSAFQNIFNRAALNRPIDKQLIGFEDA